MHAEFSKICVYCGSSPGTRDAYAQAAFATGKMLAENGIELVYGGGRAGLMGALAEGALQAGGRVTGVIPRALMARELGHQGIAELIVVEDMHVRKNRMAHLADAFIALPGGWGTMEELTEMLTWLQLGFHQKPIGILNVAGYYDHLLAFARDMSEAQFVQPGQKALFGVATEVDHLLDVLVHARPSPSPRAGERQAPNTAQRELGVK